MLHILKGPLVVEPLLLVPREPLRPVVEAPLLRVLVRQLGLEQGHQLQVRVGLHLLQVPLGVLLWKP